MSSKASERAKGAFTWLAGHIHAVVEKMFYPLIIYALFEGGLVVGVLSTIGLMLALFWSRKKEESNIPIAYNLEDYMD